MREWGAKPAKHTLAPSRIPIIILRTFSLYVLIRSINCTYCIVYSLKIKVKAEFVPLAATPSNSTHLPTTRPTVENGPFSAPKGARDDH